jgi:hypothetical protein
MMVNHIYNIHMMLQSINGVSSTGRHFVGGDMHFELYVTAHVLEPLVSLVCRSV